MAIRRFGKRFKIMLPPTVLLTLIAGFLGTALLFRTVSRLESEKISADFQQRAAVSMAAVGQGLARTEEALRTVNLLFEISDTVSRDEFALFARSMIIRAPYIQSASFQRLLTLAERANYERTMRREFPGFVIGHWDNGIRATSGLQDSYHVIDFIEPLADNERALGLDTSEKVVLKEAKQRARDTGLPSSTSLLPLPQGKSSQDGLVIFMPVYKKHAVLGSIAERRKALLGFTTIAFRATELVQQTLVAAKVLDRNGLGLRVYMGEYWTEHDLVFAHDEMQDNAVAAPRFSLFPVQEKITRSFELAGKPWHIVVSPPPDQFLVNRQGSILTLVAGIVATLLGAANLKAFATRTRRVERIVDERTNELKESNASLSKELTARRVVEQSLLLRERAIESSANAMLITSAVAPDYPITYVNSAFERTTGYKADEVIGHSCRILQGGDTNQAGLEEIRAALRDQRAGHAILRNYRKDGTLFWNDLYLSPVKDGDDRVTHFVGAQYDITDMKRYQSELEIQASRDMLTGLTNRNFLNDRLKKAIAQAALYGTSISVLMFDLDGFKLVNDTLGQQAGDLVLKTVATRLKAAALEIDTVARFGADEFVIVLPQHLNADRSTEIVQRLMHAVSERILIDERALHITSSVGIAIFPTDGADARTLLTNAGIAMYRAKACGRNNFQFYRPETNEKAHDRLRIEGELHSALERNEFVLHYQPQVDLASGEIVGMEALIRWRHPTIGMIAPLSFIGIAEDTGLIVPIGAWVIRTACAQNKKWQDAGLGPLRVAVNLSARQFAQTDLVSMIAAVLEETGLAPHCLEIELTESLVMTDVHQAILTLKQLKDLGVLLSVDDFGTGYSSLSYLKRFPIDTLKIDQAFVHDITADADDAAIVDAIISLAHSLGLKVIAEGVETEQQLNYLRRQGCDEVQGYYFSRPVACDAFELLVHKQAALT